MYYPIGRDNLSYKYFFIAHKNINECCSKIDFLKKSKVKVGSFSEKIMSRIYDSIVLDTVDLKAEYIKYYFEEYPDFETFLYNKYLIDYEELEIIKKYKDDKYTIYYGNLINNDGYTLGSLIKDNPELIKKVNKVFEECMNEN